MKKIIAFLKRPYGSTSDSKKSLITCIGVSLFIFLFLYIFQPFGLIRMDSTQFVWICAGYGLVTFLMMLINLILFPLVFRMFYDETNYTVGREIVSILILVFMIGIGNMLYSEWLGFVRLSYVTIFFFQVYTLLIAIFPTTVLVTLQYNHALRKNLKSATELNRQLSSERVQNPENECKDDLIALSSENEKEKIELHVHEIVFIKSEGNYIDVFFKKKGQLEHILLRNTLTRIEKLCCDIDCLFRCHRAYIVNLMNVRSVVGNSQGYKLHLNNTDCEIPVSRSYTKKIKGVLNARNS